MLDLFHRGVKALVFLVLAGLIVWLVQNVGCRKVESNEMEPDIKRDDFRIILTQKRLPGEINKGDIVFLEYAWPGRKEESLTGKVVGLPGDLLWVERKIVSPQMPLDGLEVRTEKPAPQDEEKFVPVVVPRDTYFVACRNQREFSSYDSRGVGPFGVWAVRGRRK